MCTRKRSTNQALSGRERGGCGHWMTAVLLLHIGIASGFDSNTLLPRHMRWGGSLVPAGGRLGGQVCHTSASGCILALRGAGGEAGEGCRGENRGGRHEVLVLFDIDGTLTKPRQPVDAPVLNALMLLREMVNIMMILSCNIWYNNTTT